MNVVLFPIEEVFPYTTERNTDNTINIVEKPTGHRIYNNVAVADADKILVRLNYLGKGFNGWTPSFCLPCRKIKKV